VAAPVHRRMVPRMVPVAGGGAGHRVTTLELFFDLVFVFAFTQVTALVAGSPTVLGAARGLVLGALLWWIWCSYSWLGNQARADEGLVRLALFAAMVIMMMLALAIPQAWSSQGRGPALLLVGCTLLVQWIHLGVYVVAAAGDRGLLRQLAIAAVPVLVGNVLLLVGGLAGPQGRTGWWAAGMLVNYTGIYAAGAEGWRLPSPAHFAERYALIVLIALGESVVAVGVGVGTVTLTPSVVAATATAIVLSITLWWLYFDVLAYIVEHHLAAAPSGVAQSSLARDALTFLHFPVVVSVLALAVGIKKVFGTFDGHHGGGLAEALGVLATVLLAGGPAVYLLGVAMLHRRLHGRIDRPLLAVAAALVVLAVLAGLGGLDGVLSPLGYLFTVTGGMVMLVLLVSRSQPELRRRYRYGEAPAPVGVQD